MATNQHQVELGSQVRRQKAGAVRWRRMGPGIVGSHAELASIPGRVRAVKPGTLTVLVIDDQPTGRLLMSEILKGVDPRAHIVGMADPHEALAYAAEHRVDFVLTDYRMPALDGVETIRRLRSLPRMSEVPIVCVTVVEDRDVKYRALQAGATDFLKRPLDPFECAARCRNLLALRRQQLLAQDYTEDLERRIAQATQEVRESEMETLFRLAKAAEQRDSDTGLHLVRMAKYSAVLARECGWGPEEQKVIELTAPLHDIGKIGIPDGILQARRRLTDEEMSVMRTHADIGYVMLQGSQSRYLKIAASIAHCHHEKVDGTGYPRGLAGEVIPMEARIVAVADVFDALTSNRPYKSAWTVKEAIDYLRSERGRHFDARLVDHFLRVEDELDAIRLTYRDPVVHGN